MMMKQPPDIATSTRAERLWYVKDRFPCIADCDQCGFCAAYHGKDPTAAYADYIDGKAGFLEVSKRYR